MASPLGLTYLCRRLLKRMKKRLPNQRTGSRKLLLDYNFPSFFCTTNVYWMSLREYILPLFKARSANLEDICNIRKNVCGVVGSDKLTILHRPRDRVKRTQLLYVKDRALAFSWILSYSNPPGVADKSLILPCANSQSRLHDSAQSPPLLHTHLYSPICRLLTSRLLL